jgi:type II secretion system protein J
MRIHSRRGLTLLEVLVAMVIMAVIGLFSWQSLHTAADTRDVIEDSHALDRQIQAALGKIERGISLAFLTPNVAAVNTYKTVFIGQDEGDMDRLFFSTKAHLRTVRGTRECDQAEMTLWTEQDPERTHAYVLYQRESGRIDEEPDVGGTISPLLAGVTRFDLRFLDPEDGEWREDWDTTGTETPNRLPRAVQIVLTVEKTDPLDSTLTSEESYVRTVILETAPEITKSLLDGQSTDNPGFGGLSL